MANRFRTVDRDSYLFPRCRNGCRRRIWLAVVEVVSKLELRKLEDSYTKRGSEGYHPAWRCCFTDGGVFDRKLEQATKAFRYLAGNTHPDHDTIAHFRKRFLEELKPLFVEILVDLNERVAAYNAGTRRSGLQLAEEADGPEGMDIPAELRRSR